MTSPPAPDPGHRPDYDDLLRRAKLVATFRKIQRREASARMNRAVQASRGVAIDAAMLEQTRRNRPS